VGQWLKSFDSSLNEKAKEEALQWALQRGSRSGRVAYQFARDWAGRHSKKR
jgi:predicted AAA+ superfamily ATPase